MFDSWVEEIGLDPAAYRFGRPDQAVRSRT